MSNRVAQVGRIVLTATGICLVGAGMAGVAEAAPASADAPAAQSGTDAPAAPKLTDLPVPLVFQPIDATNSLFGVPRGSIPTIGTPDGMPGLAVTPLAVQEDTPAPTDTSGSALAGRDNAAFVDSLPQGAPQR